MAPPRHSLLDRFDAGWTKLNVTANLRKPFGRTFVSEPGDNFTKYVLLAHLTRASVWLGTQPKHTKAPMWIDKRMCCSANALLNYQGEKHVLLSQALV